MYSVTLGNLLRTPLGIIVIAYAIVVIGLAAAAFLLNVPILLVLGGALLAAALGFWFVTRKERSATEKPAGNAPPKP